MNTSPIATPPTSGRQRLAAASVRGFHAYANWLVGITWKRFFLLSLLLLIATGILKEVPPFTWAVSERVVTVASKPRKLVVDTGHPTRYEVTIDKQGIRVRPQGAASAASSAASAAGPSVSIDLAADSTSEEVRRAVEEALDEAADESDPRPGTRVVVTRLGDPLPALAMLLIITSIVIKISYKGRLQAEVKAAQATVTAEAETLKRQVVEARMAAMQAQVEPHFLFNTLASIDHLIETDPQRASRMQKNLIALLRASMPTLREADTNLGRELAVVRPYLEILKVRMEERLRTEIRVSEGLLSAEFPPMMLQSLVENAIKHGLEPKADGGTLTVAADVVHGKLAVSVADTGMGFGKAATSGTGVGLANIRERLALHYGSRAQLAVADNPAGGTTVTITVPYVSKARPGDDA